MSSTELRSFIFSTISEWYSLGSDVWMEVSRVTRAFKHSVSGFVGFCEIIVDNDIVSYSLIRALDRSSG